MAQVRCAPRRGSRLARRVGLQGRAQKSSSAVHWIWIAALPPAAARTAAFWRRRSSMVRSGCRRFGQGPAPHDARPRARQVRASRAAPHHSMSFSNQPTGKGLAMGFLSGVHSRATARRARVRQVGCTFRPTGGGRIDDYLGEDRKRPEWGIREIEPQIEDRRPQVGFEMRRPS